LDNQVSIVELTLVACCQQSILAVQLPDERIFARVESFCDALQVDTLAQLRRIRRQPALTAHLVSVLVMTPSGLQEVEVLAAQAIPAWLSAFKPAGWRQRNERSFSRSNEKS